MTDLLGDPVAQATVMWGQSYEKSGETVFTEPNGNYRLRITRLRDDFVLRCFAKGYGVHTQSVAWGTEEEPQKVDFQLEPGHWLAGVTVNEKGAPIPRIQVAVKLRESGEPRYDNDPLPGENRVVRTDAQGAFAFQDLPGPAVKLDLVGKGWSEILEEDVEVDREVRIVMKPSGVIRGRVIDNQTREPIPQFTVGVAATCAT